jgi:hypothetical protein
MEAEKLDVFLEFVTERVVEVGGFECVMMLPLVLVAMRAGKRRLTSGLRQVRQAHIMEVLSSTVLILVLVTSYANGMERGTYAHAPTWTSNRVKFIECSEGIRVARRTMLTIQALFGC